jgi:hypothetical protein
MLSLEPALNLADPEHLTHMCRLSKALERVSPEIAIVEERTNEAMCCRGDDNRVGLGNRLQARDQIRGLADCGFSCVTPTTTTPEPMAVRVCTATSTAVFNVWTALRMARPARIARSASFSCAAGYPKYASTPSPRYCAVMPPSNLISLAQHV